MSGPLDAALLSRCEDAEGPGGSKPIISSSASASPPPAPAQHQPGTSPEKSGSGPPPKKVLSPAQARAQQEEYILGLQRQQQLAMQQEQQRQRTAIAQQLFGIAQQHQFVGGGGVNQQQQQQQQHLVVNPSQPQHSYRPPGSLHQQHVSVPPAVAPGLQHASPGLQRVSVPPTMNPSPTSGASEQHYAMLLEREKQKYQQLWQLFQQQQRNNQLAAQLAAASSATGVGGTGTGGGSSHVNIKNGSGTSQVEDLPGGGLLSNSLSNQVHVSDDDADAFQAFLADANNFSTSLLGELPAQHTMMGGSCSSSNNGVDSDVDPATGLPKRQSQAKKYLDKLIKKDGTIDHSKIDADESLSYYLKKKIKAMTENIDLTKVKDSLSPPEQPKRPRGRPPKSSTSLVVVNTSKDLDSKVNGAGAVASGFSTSSSNNMNGVSSSANMMNGSSSTDTKNVLEQTKDVPKDEDVVDAFDEEDEPSGADAVSPGTGEYHADAALEEDLETLPPEVLRNLFPRSTEAAQHVGGTSSSRHLQLSGDLQNDLQLSGDPKEDINVQDLYSELKKAAAGGGSSLLSREGGSAKDGEWRGKKSRAVEREAKRDLEEIEGVFGAFGSEAALGNNSPATKDSRSQILTVLRKAQQRRHAQELRQTFSRNVHRPAKLLRKWLARKLVEKKWRKAKVLNILAEKQERPSTSSRSFFMHALF